MFTRTVRASAVAAAAALTVGVFTTSAAEAKPTKPGSPTLTASATEPAIGTYNVSLSWDAVAGATSYKATVVRSGATLASATLTTTSWNKTVAATPGQVLTLSVKAVVAHQQSKPATATLTLKDLIAPTASYTASWDNNTGVATLAEVGLADDSALSGVTRSVNWGDGTTKAYAPGQAITHTYQLTQARYVPEVTLKDAAGNTTGPVDAEAVVINDDQAPTGSFSVSPANAWATFTSVTLTQQGVLSDNWSPADHISRTVSWGDGTTASWTSTDPLTHVYATAGSYTPTVTLTDEAGNHADVSTSAVTVVRDDVAPTGSFSVAPGKAWASFSTVTLTQQGVLSDNHSTPDHISRTVTWGDGSTTDWTSAGPLTHVYAVAGTYTPTVTLTDEAGNHADVQSSAVTVTTDTVGPKVVLSLPTHQQSVRAWKTLRGKATDAQTGVAKVWLRAVEKRGRSWFGYNAVTKKWVRTTTKAKAFARSKPFALATDARHRWVAPLAGLSKGTLVYRVRAADRVGNLSRSLTHQAALTRP